MKYLSLLFLLFSIGLTAQEDFGKLIFEDDFERSESQEEKDELGNGWTTSSDKTAEGNKQVDLRDGHMYIYTHKVAWHATSVRHTYAFQDGTIGLKLKFDDPNDTIHLNFTDIGEKSVHAGHLFNVTINPSSVKIEDLKTGKMKQTIRTARKNKTLSEAQKKELTKKGKEFPNTLETGKWHQVYATVKGNEVTCTINGKVIGSYTSPGFAHETKTMIRLLVAKNIHVDDMRIWRKK
ncbi:MAG: LamG domain-containing protein [Lentisphaeraceae bacterium]|nr:LamG domain-containing protein [Lentisphaeraceae bacterium]